MTTSAAGWRLLSIVLTCAACASTVSGGTNTHADAAVDSSADRSNVTPALDAVADVAPDVPTLDRGCSTVACEPIEGMRINSAARFVVHRDGTTRVWGTNRTGAFGLGTTSERPTIVPIAGPSLGPLRQLAVGNGTVCALTVPGDVYCWGTSAEGELGDGRLVSQQYQPPTSPLVRGAIELQTNGIHYCAYFRDRSIECWGFLWDPMGDPRMQPSGHALRPTAAFATFDVARVAGSFFGTVDCVIDVTQHLWCRGAAEWGELTNNAPVVRSDFVPIELPGPVESVATGYWTVCAVTNDGAIWCWGRSDAGQIPGHSGAVDRPTRIEGVPASVKVVVGRGQVCALTREGAVWCWGNNNDGSVDPGVARQIIAPRAVQGLPPMRDVVCQADSCAQAIADGHVWCWGLAGDEPTETVVN